MYSVSRQVEIMENVLGRFDNIVEKMQFMHSFYDCDPSFTQEARDIVRGNIVKALPE